MLKYKEQINSNFVKFKLLTCLEFSDLDFEIYSQFGI
jgi:hypothetical protein